MLLSKKELTSFWQTQAGVSAHPNARVTHLTRCMSNHCPVLLESNLSNGVHLPRPFKFQSFWLSNLSFPGIVSESWSRSGPFQVAIDCFSRKASEWNRNHFGNIFRRKRRVLARLNGIQKALADNPSHSLIEMEKTLYKELNVLLCQEEELWVQKSCINWMIEGDRNISFHHMSTIVRRRRNRISCIKNDMGEWIHIEFGAMNYIR
ncbi:uncharacterized protein LOC142635672 [Castanea sativa]|uniref:uncharacterized protein LOC142635672 n=1 Tax=Castanea sativa TaxID=21020 RepID=UPI003F6504E6